MKTKELVKVKSYSDIWPPAASKNDFRLQTSDNGVFFTKVLNANIISYIKRKFWDLFYPWKIPGKTPKITIMRHVCMWCVLVLLCEGQSLDWESRRPRWWLEKCWRGRVLSLSNSLSSDPTATAKKQYWAKVRVAISSKILERIQEPKQASFQIGSSI